MSQKHDIYVMLLPTAHAPERTAAPRFRFSSAFVIEAKQKIQTLFTFSLLGIKNHRD